MCAATGLALAAFARLILLLMPSEVLEIVTYWVPDNQNRHHLLTFLLGPISACLANVFYALHYWMRVEADAKSHASTPWEWANSAHVRRSGNPMRRMLVQAVDSNGAQLLLLSLSSRKVYCGAVRRLPSTTSGEEFIEVIPMFSATRNKDTLLFEHRIDYPAFHIWRLRRRIDMLMRLSKLAARNAEAANDLDVIEEELADHMALLASVTETAPEHYKDKIDIDLWSKVIPARTIESLSFFDEEGNDRWFRFAPACAQLATVSALPSPSARADRAGVIPTCRANPSSTSSTYMRPMGRCATVRTSSTLSKRCKPTRCNGTRNGH